MCKLLDEIIAKSEVKTVILQTRFLKWFKQKIDENLLPTGICLVQ